MRARNDVAPSRTPHPALEYARRLFEDVTTWYQNADTKAEVILTIDGVFLAFLTSSLFAESTAAILNTVTPLTWVWLVLMSLSLTGSIVSALAGLWSRLHTPTAADKSLEDLHVRVEDGSTYAPESMWFFQRVRRLDERQFQARLQTVDEAFEIQVLAHEIHALSTNVEKKHRWVDRGFVLAGASLVLFLAAGASHVVGH
jgi:hypothetical protein